MVTVLFVTPSLARSGATRRLTLLVEHLPRDRFRPRVAVLGGPSHGASALRAAGVEVDELGGRRPFDARPYFALRQLAREHRPDVVHARGGAGLRAALLAGIATPGRLVVSDALPPVGAPGWLGRGLLRRVGRVVAFGRAEAERYRRLGVPADRLTEAPLATGLEGAPGEPPTANGSPLILGVGPMERHKGFRDAVWAFDILHFLYDDLRLVLAGDGPDRPHVEEFVRVTRTAGRVRCTGPLDDLRPLRREAALAWVPGRAGGVQVALEAMAAGLAVVAARTPRLAEVVAHAETGLLFTPGDKADLARQTKRLLDDVARRRALGEAARRRAAEHFAPGPMAEACARAYGG